MGTRADLRVIIDTGSGAYDDLTGFITDVVIEDACEVYSQAMFGSDSMYVVPTALTGGIQIQGYRYPSATEDPDGTNYRNVHEKSSWKTPIEIMWWDTDLDDFIAAEYVLTSGGASVSDGLWMLDGTFRRTDAPVIFGDMAPAAIVGVSTTTSENHYTSWAHQAGLYLLGWAPNIASSPKNHSYVDATDDSATPIDYRFTFGAAQDYGLVWATGYNGTTIIPAGNIEALLMKTTAATDKRRWGYGYARTL